MKSAPFMIWTMQRTGGTTLTNLLAMLSGREPALHEPLNHDRELGYIPAGWAAEGNYDQLLLRVREAITWEPVIKHCFEISGNNPFIDASLLTAADELGYSHIVLDRSDEIGRILSQHLASITNAWDHTQSGSIYRQIIEGEYELPDIDIGTCIEHFKTCRRRRAEVLALFQEKKTPFLQVRFEDIYKKWQGPGSVLDKVFDHIGIEPQELQRRRSDILNFLQNKDQNSGLIYRYFRNYDKYMAEMNWVTSE